VTDRGLPFVKGHGTENDFVLIPDRDGDLDITAEAVRAICDRRAGVGGDGVIRVVLDDGIPFMDYRNADGSIAEMCGNGARVFARFLVDAGWQQPGTFPIDTRAGRRLVTVPAVGDVRVEMGPVRLGVPSAAGFAGRVLDGTAVDVGNPHLACWGEVDPDDVDLSRAPRFDAGVFPEGVNVEIVFPQAPDRVRMRVFERGVGETRSCGTGTVAAAAVHLAATGRSGGTVAVQVPGGLVTVELAAGTGRDFPTSSLTGPAVLVAEGSLRPELTGSVRPAPAARV
jgi:diaminopimelate epimerase